MSRVRTVIAAAVPQAFKTWRSRNSDTYSDFEVLPSSSSELGRRERPLPPRPISSISYGSSSMRTSPERYRRDSLLNIVPEESGTPDSENGDGGTYDAEDDEHLLEEQGLYRGQCTYCHFLIYPTNHIRIVQETSSSLLACAVILSGAIHSSCGRTTQNLASLAIDTHPFRIS